MNTFLFLEYEQQLKISEENITHLKLKLQEKDLQIIDLSERIKYHECKRSGKSSAVYDDLEKRIALQNIEINRLNLQLRQRIQEIEVMKIKLKRFEVGEFSGITMEYENRITLLLREIEEWKLKFSQNQMINVSLKMKSNFG